MQNHPYPESHSVIEGSATCTYIQCDFQGRDGSAYWQMEKQNHHHPYPESHTVIEISATYIYSVTFRVGVVLHKSKWKCRTTPTLKATL